MHARIDAQQVLTDALFKASTENVATAFTAAKEAVSKQEADTAKQLDRLRDMIGVGEKAVAQRFEDLKGRMDRGEGKGAGFAGAAAFIATAVSVVAALVTIAVLAFGKS